MASAARRKKNCVFCKMQSSDQNLGPFDILPPHKFHSNCLIFSWHIRQNKDKTKGLKGFEKKSIDYTLEEAKNESCTFCKKKGATLKCSGDGNTTCEIRFHLPCALKRKITLHEYFGGFKSYCLEHISRKCKFDNEPITGIAFIATCCNQLYSHDECLEDYVMRETKSQLKCPACKNVKDFVQFMKENYTVEIRTDSDTDYSRDESFDLGATSIENRNRAGKFHRKEDMVMIRCSKCKKCFGIHHKTRANLAENSAWRCQNCQKCDMEEDQSESEVEIGTKRKR